MLSGGLGCYSIVSSPLISPLLGGQGSLSRRWPSERGPCLLWPLLASLSLALAVLFHTRQGFECLVGISFPKRSTQLEFLKRNVSGYVCNPSSSREMLPRRGHTSGIPVSACFIPRKLIPVPPHVLLYFLVSASPRP